MNDQAITVTLFVIDVIESLGIPYFIGGSLASAHYGVGRTTLDSDLIVDLRFEHIAAFVAQLQDRFYVSAPSIIDALVDKGSFNLIHLETMFKVDIFIPKESSFAHNQFANCKRVVLVEDSEQTAFVASAEDTILAKLEWYKLGGEVSERQLNDIRGVIRRQRDRLDFVYLRQQAIQLKLDDLLDPLLNEPNS